MKLIKQSWFSLAMMQVGGAMSLPLILVGFELEKKWGFYQALFAILLGNLFLYVLSIISSLLSQESEKTTAETAERYLGRLGKVLFALVIVLSTATWFSIQTALIGRDLSLLCAKWGYPIERALLLNGGLACLITFSCAGIDRIQRFANFLVPLLAASLFFILYQVYGASHHSILDESLKFEVQGIALTISCSIATVIDMPTFFRHAKSKKDAIKAVTLIYFIGLPLIEAIGLFIGFYSPQNELLGALLGNSGIVVFSLLAFIIVFAGWATNNLNFYSTCAGLASLFPHVEAKKIERAGAFFCIALSLAPILQSFDLALEVMGVLWTAFGAPILCGYILERCSGSPQKVQNYFLAACFGALVGTLSLFYKGIVFSIPLLDSFFAATLFLLFIEVLIKKVHYEST
jgi:cytosine permease